VLARSTDQGSTWQESDVETALVPAERFVALLPPCPSLAVDQHSGNLYVAFQDARAGDADVYLWSSQDGGRHFGSARRVNDTPSGDGTSQYLPALSVAPDGRLDILYYDRRDDSTNLVNEVSLQSSFDNGVSFSSHLRVSDRSFDSQVGFGSDRNLPDLGSRLALISADARALAVWTDTRAGTQASGKQDLARAFVTFSTARRRGNAVVGVGGLVVAAAGLALAATGLVRSRRRGDLTSSA
jgi:hypothetical protein